MKHNLWASPWSFLILSPASTHIQLMGQAPTFPGQSFRKKWRKLYFLQVLNCPLVWLPGLWYLEFPSPLVIIGYQLLFSLPIQELFFLFFLLCFEVGVEVSDPMMKMNSFQLPSFWCMVINSIQFQFQSLIPNFLWYNVVSHCRWPPQKFWLLEV